MSKSSSLIQLYKLKVSDGFCDMPDPNWSVVQCILRNIQKVKLTITLQVIMIINSSVSLETMSDSNVVHASCTMRIAVFRLYNVSKFCWLGLGDSSINHYSISGYTKVQVIHVKNMTYISHHTAHQLWIRMQNLKSM